MGMSDTMLVDTDVLVDFLRGFEKATDFINKYSSKIILSSIVVAELYAGVKGTNELTVLDNFVSPFSRCPNNRQEIAKAGGLYKRDFGKSHGVGLADAILAATADKEKSRIQDAKCKTLPNDQRHETSLQEVMGQPCSAPALVRPAAITGENSRCVWKMANELSKKNAIGT